ncbi:hypothetical protein EYS14_04610 [Alteromonadaceae bacterium M269]|nr:hypothetical protein EYS14_04610 [Alteromonadaceae bacterium M269]
MYHAKYWRELDQLKVHIFYLEGYLEKTVKIDRFINIFLAIASNGSIASWVIWKELSPIWGAIIAVSQAINAIKGLLPYSKRLKSLQNITNDLESLFLAMENKWFDVAEGKLTEEQIHKLHMQFKEKRRQIIQKHLGSSPLPENTDLLNKAKKDTQTYFNNFYSLGET